MIRSLARRWIRQVNARVPAAIEPAEWIASLLMTRFTSAPALPLEGPCLVLGAAPDPALPRDFDAHWTLLTANSAQVSLRALGCDRPPDITVMNGLLVGHKPSRIARKDAIRGLHTEHLVLIERGVSSQASVSVLQSLGYEFSDLTVLSFWQRSKIWNEVLQHHLPAPGGCRRVSTGVFAALYALYSGAAPVVLSGFSLTKSGYSYDLRGRSRFHVKADLFALMMAAEKQLPLFAADRDLADAAGLRIWASN
jgi:hypothetical protein